MKNAIANQNDADDTEWAERGDYWQKLVAYELKHNDRIKRRLNLPLILSGHGIKIRIDRGTLWIRNGFTHYPQQPEEYRFFPRDRRLPSRIILLDSKGYITFDAMAWLATQGIQLVQINWQGEVISVGGGLGYAANLDIVDAQNQINKNGRGAQFANYLIEQKIANCIATIKQVFPPCPATQLALQQLNTRLNNIRKNQFSRSSKLLGEEGIAASAYFRCWHSRPLQWKGINKKPIPDDWRRIGPRMSSSKSNQFASHPVNAMLNYCYAVLQNQVQTIILASGFNPYIGYIHSDDTRNKPKLVFDLMEPLRPIIDRKILEFVQGHVFSPSDFVINNMGVCKMHPQFARMVVKLVQDMKEVENITVDNLRKLLALHPAASRKASRNISAYKARLIGKRE